MTTSKMKDADMPLRDRIEAAIKRVTTGYGQMRVPVEATDPDVVLFDCLAELDAAKVRETRLLGLLQSTPCTIYEAGHGECRELLTDVLMMCDRCRALVEAGDPHA